jgi:integrase
MTEHMKDGIIQRGATFSYVVRERDPQTGKTKPRWVGGFPSRTAAKKARDAARHAVNRGTYVAPQDLKVGKYLDDWIEAHSVELKPSTIASYKNKINLYLKPAIGHERLQALSPNGLSVVFRDLHKHGGADGKPVSARTVEFARAVLRRAMNDAVVNRLIEVNPVIGSKAQRKSGKPKHVTWTADQVRAFLDATSDSRSAPLWQLALATGMRRGELMALTWECVKLEEYTVTVERSTAQVGKELVTTTPKSDESRDVQIDARTVAALRTWRKVQAEERLAWGPAYQDTEGIVFTREDGSRLSPNAVSKAFLRAQAGLRLPRLTFHDMRHTHITILLRGDRGKGIEPRPVPVHIVAKRAGHKDATVTLAVYADVIPDDDASAVDVFSKAVWARE